ncbi:uncharacterized protein [Procambarus clarkii]|uniref:uncharacterized protein n=1 Tax=Procambarus clarkii TaxID=6728 RepID=UPI003743246A
MSGASRERRGRWRRVLGLLPYAILLVVVPTPASAPLTQLNSNQHADNADNSEGCTLCYSRDAALGLGRHGKPTVPPALCSEGNCARDDDDGFNGDLGIAGNGDLNKDDINSEASENSSHDLVSGVVGGTEELLGLKSEFAEKENESDLTPGPRTTLGLSKPLLLSGHQGTQIASPGDHGGDDSLLVRASNEAAPHHNYEGIIRSIQARRKVSQVSEPPGDLPHVSGRYPLRPPGDNTTRDSRMEGTQGGHSKHTKETQGGQSNHMDDTQRRRSHMLSKQNYLGTNKQRSRGRETDSSLERQQRVVRRAEKTQQPQDSAAQPAEMRPANCTSAPSCSGQQPALGARYPCSCDAHCHVYGDCCQGVQTPLHQTTPTTLSPSFFTCSSLTPSAHRMWATPKMVYMVGRCPAETEPQLAAKCARTAPATYLMDIPVFSNASGVVYSNVYCSKCHHDFRIERMNVSITCSLNITSAAELANMTYHPGQLRWTLANSEGEEVPSGIPVLHSQPSMSCLLDVNYPETVGRRCEETVNSCKVDWPDKENWQRCSSYNYYVEVNDIVYKNWDCAICNEEEEGDIQCLYKYPIIDDLDLRIFAQPPSLIDLFIIDGECEDNQVWDILHHRCEDVSCGFLFTLVDGKCLRNNKTVDGRPYLNISCYTRDFNRDYSVMFPNQSIYLNHTEKTYDLGEYEFNSSWIRVCRPEGRWTPVMNKISAVLISISLVCMFLHMIIFLALPKRRNIPSMNLFSMTVSLFITEFIFVNFFHMNQNYTSCVIISVMIYYFLSASFLWMNVMSIDICRTFLSRTYKMKSRSVFFQYSIYAWSVPLVGSLTAVSVNQLSSPEFLLTPQFGTDVCWFNNKWGLVAFFTLPSSLVILSNVMLYAMSVYSIYKQMKSGEFASSTIHKSSSQQGNGKKKEKFLKSSNVEVGERMLNVKSNEESGSPRCAERIKERIHRRIVAHKKQRIRLVLYCKLALMMGLTWVSAFLSLHTLSIVFEYLFIVFNGLQGTFIFIAFDCKQKVWYEIRQKIASMKKFQPDSTSSSFTTKSTSLRTSSDRGYKYRWSSSRRQDGSRKHSSVSGNQSESQILQSKNESNV